MGIFRKAPSAAEIAAAAKADDAEDAAKARQRLIDQAERDQAHRAGKPTPRVGGSR
jgi:hypothetical protein